MMSAGRILGAAVVAYFAACAMAVALIAYAWARDDIHPPQPVAYDHQVHVHDNNLDCGHCHQYADRGPRATVPAMSVCAECHQGMATDNPAVQELQRYLGAREPVPWLKVHTQPWHVYFTHQAHLARQVACQACHGEVSTMSTARRVRSLEMGWCLGCHRLQGASDDCWTCHR